MVTGKFLLGSGSMTLTFFKCHFNSSQPGFGEPASDINGSFCRHEDIVCNKSCNSLSERRIDE